MPLQTTAPGPSGVLGLEELPFPPGYSASREGGGGPFLPADEKALVDAWASMKAKVDPLIDQPVLLAYGRVTAAGPAYLYSKGTTGLPVLNGAGDWLINLDSAHPAAETQALVNTNSLAGDTGATIERQTDLQYRVQTVVGGLANSNIDFTFQLWSVP